MQYQGVSFCSTFKKRLSGKILMKKSEEEDILKCPQKFNEVGIVCDAHKISQSSQFSQCFHNTV